MFDSKSPLVKIGGYVVIGFFMIIIIISFGMPDFISRIGFDQNTVASINGETVSYVEFVRFRENFAQQYGLKDSNDKELQKYVLNALIENRLQIQKAKNLKIKVSDEKVREIIKTNFTDKTGQFNNDYYERYLRHYQYSKSEYFFMVKDILINREMMQMLENGLSVSPEEVKMENTMKKSQLQVKYCYLSEADFKKRVEKEIQVTDGEINQELAKNASEVKDPKTDRERIRKKLEIRKVEQRKKEIVDQINKMAIARDSFDKTAAVLKGKVGLSNVFKIGEPMKENAEKGKVLSAISESKVFRDEFLRMEPGKSSRIISAIDGLYIFAPVKREIKMETPDASTYAAIENGLLRERLNSLYFGFMNQFREKSKIVRNLRMQ